jgi:2-polyprenyl-3-methyl-5-hydroxy-6-metoxy-1,4-benzoquinol methylase
MIVQNSVGICRFCGLAVKLSETGRIVNGFHLYLYECCGTVGTITCPSGDEMRIVYDSLFSFGDYGQHRDELQQIKSGKLKYSNYRKIMLRRARTLVSGNCLVEIGVGSGAFGFSSKKGGWNYQGYDISTSAVDFAKQIGLNAKTFNSDGFPEMKNDSVDVFVMWEVIEHVWDVDKYLQNIFSALKNDGILIMSTPNYLRDGYSKNNNWGAVCSPPIHINFFTKESFEKVLFSHGFKNPKVYKRKIYKPDNLSYVSITRAVSRLLSIEESPTLCCFARK